MLNSQLLDVYRCSDQMEGEIVRSQIAASGIPAFVQGDDAVTSIALAGAPTRSTIVRVLVASEDYDRALRILDTTRETELRGAPWICDGCSETNGPVFDLCWKCGKDRSDA